MISKACRLPAGATASVGTRCQATPFCIFSYQERLISTLKSRPPEHFILEERVGCPDRGHRKTSWQKAGASPVGYPRIFTAENQLCQSLIVSVLLQVDKHKLNLDNNFRFTYNKHKVQVYI